MSWCKTTYNTAVSDTSVKCTKLMIDYYFSPIGVFDTVHNFEVVNGNFFVAKVFLLFKNLNSKKYKGGGLFVYLSYSVMDWCNTSENTAVGVSYTTTLRLWVTHFLECAT